VARWPRLAASDVPMHITQRGNNRVATFLCQHDFAQYREFLLTASASEGCAINAYALMTNHVHLLVTPQTASGPSRMMQALGRMYVRYFNLRYRRSGTLWEGRFKSALIDSSAYFLACSRYIDLNPVRAAMVMTPGAYEWSSFAQLALDVTDPLVTFHPAYLALGRSAPERCRAYGAWCAGAEPTDQHDAIRRATLGGSAIGSEPFRQRLAKSLQRCVIRLPHGGDRRGNRAPIKGSESLIQQDLKPAIKDSDPMMRTP